MNFALLNPKVWFEIACVAILAGAIWFAYHWAYSNGARDVQIKFDAYKTEQVQMAQQQEAANRLKEQGFQTSLENLTNAYIKEHSAHLAAAASANSMLDSFNAALGSKAAPDSPAARVPDGGAGPEQELLGNCASTLVRLAAEADRLEEVIVGLQTYIKDIVLRK